MAAISIARLAVSCPVKSAISGSDGGGASMPGFTGDNNCVPRRWFNNSVRLLAAKISISPPQAASDPFSAGQINRCDRSAAHNAAGRAPETV